VRCAGISATRSRYTMSKSRSPSAVWRRITRRSGVGCNDTVPKLEQRLRRRLKPTNKSWRVDETYIRVQGSWCYLYRAIDSTGATIDFLLSALRDAAATKRLLRKVLGDPSHPQPRVINTDKGPPLRFRDCSRKRERNPAPALPPSTGPILEQHPGAGSSSDQTTSEGQAELSRVPSSRANDSRIRGDAHDSQGAGVVQRC
jgi:DDE superfamily endonuclease